MKYKTTFEEHHSKMPGFKELLWEYAKGITRNNKKYKLPLEATIEILEAARPSFIRIQNGKIVEITWAQARLVFEYNKWVERRKA